MRVRNLILFAVILLAFGCEDAEPESQLLAAAEVCNNPDAYAGEHVQLDSLYVEVLSDCQASNCSPSADAGGDAGSPDTGGACCQECVGQIFVGCGEDDDRRILLRRQESPVLCEYTTCNGGECEPADCPIACPTFEDHEEPDRHRIGVLEGTFGIGPVEGHTSSGAAPQYEFVLDDADVRSALY